MGCSLVGCGGSTADQAAQMWKDPCASSDGSTRTVEPDHAIFTRLLQAHVRAGEKDGIRSTLVDYAAIREDPSDLSTYLSQLCFVDLDELSVAQRLATLINAYNAVMIATVVKYNPTGSVTDLDSSLPEGSVWKHKFCTLAGNIVSLDEIEHGMIRAGLSAEFGAQGQIHAAVNCASLSCPDLRSEAFESSELLEQLNAATAAWLDNPTKNEGPDDSGALYLSMIFRWYSQDFVDDSGSVQAFVRKHTSWDVFDDAPLSYKTYSWGLNDQV